MMAQVGAISIIYGLFIVVLTLVLTVLVVWTLILSIRALRLYIAKNTPAPGDRNA